MSGFKITNRNSSISRYTKILIFIRNPNLFIKWLSRKIYLMKLKRNDFFEWIIEMWKYRGLRIGKNCIIFDTFDILSEPVLVEIGNNVIITGGVKFLTHDGAPMLYRDEIGEKETYGTIKIGNNVFIGMCSIILPNVKIGNNVIIGAGSVVRRNIPDNSVISGNPAEVNLKTDIAKKFILSNKNLISRVSSKTEVQSVEYLFEHFNLDCSKFPVAFKFWEHFNKKSL